MFNLLCLLSLITTSMVNCSPINRDENIIHEWNEFKSFHGKNYENEDTERFRLNVFNENKRMIIEHNKMADAGLKSYRLAMNQFGDLLTHEFKKQMFGTNASLIDYSKGLNATLFKPMTNENLPKSVDWRKRGYVTPVKDQGTCASGWAFSVTGAMEGNNFHKTGKLVSLSEQNLIDCSNSSGNHGCDGGTLFQAFSYIMDNHGIDTEQSYPYEGIEGKCRFNYDHVGATLGAFWVMYNEDILTTFVANGGPVSVTIDAGHQSFQFYSSGVYDEPECSSTELNHSLLVVGYGIDSSNKKYYIVKNSWGEKWGNKGYIHMSRDKNNQCGIATIATYPD